MSRTYLSPPDVAPDDLSAIERAFSSGWIAPLGPEVDAFELELARVTGRAHGVALSSGTAGLHLALLIQGVGVGDRVLVSSLTFSATVNAIRYVGAEPVFIDSRFEDWEMDPELLEAALREGPYAACLPVDIYGQCADFRSISPMLAEHDVVLIEDAAESLGAKYMDRPAGSFGVMAALSFNGNKIITTSGGGALVTDNEEWAERARFLATQARDPAPHYQHSEIGFNYRLSNLLAALGRSQLADLERRVERRRAHNEAYRLSLGDLPGVEFMPESAAGRSTFWLTCLTIDPHEAGVDRETVRLHLESLDIESRPVWKPMHLQPDFERYRVYGGDVSARLFENGLCLPSGSSLTDDERQSVIEGIRDVFGAG
jgi:dTDP-4-amino-4,6-dideoxygalactose transaminase